MTLFATNFYLPYFNNLYLLKNNSLITFFNGNSQSFIKNPSFKEELNQALTLNSNNERPDLATLRDIPIDLGRWFFRESFIYKIKNRFLYLTNSVNFYSLISKKCLLLVYLSKLGCGFKVSCTLVGVGYRVTNLKNNILTLKLGRSYKVKYFIPSLVMAKVFGKRKTKIRFFSSDLIKLMTSVYLFRSLKWPDSYKGKGIKITKQKSAVKFREKFGSIHYKGKK